VAGSAQQMRFGAQTVFYQPKGAFTGAVSASMLKSLECEYVLVGHSERRSVFKETDEEINRSLKQVLENEMVPILCVGETLEQYESGGSLGVVGTCVWLSLLSNLCCLVTSAQVVAYDTVSFASFH